MRLRLGQVLLATNSTLSAVLRVRNLPEPHVRPSRQSINHLASGLRGHEALPDSVRWNARRAFQSRTSAPERALLPPGKVEAATASQDPIEIKAFGTRPGRTRGSDRFRTLKCPAGISIPNFCARAGAVAARQSRGGNCEPGLDRSGTACPPGPLRQFLIYPIPREERE